MHREFLSFLICFIFQEKYDNQKTFYNCLLLWNLCYSARLMFMEFYPFVQKVALKLEKRTSYIAIDSDV